MLAFFCFGVEGGAVGFAGDTAGAGAAAAFFSDAFDGVAADDEPAFGAADLSGALEEACVALGYGDPARRAELMDALTNGVPDDVVAQVVATRGGDRGHVAQELARQAGPFREALKRVAISTRLGRKIDKDRDAEAGGDDLTDEDIVQRLREMGPCPMGFAWHREGSGWRCGGGSHFVHDDDPMLQA